MKDIRINVVQVSCDQSGGEGGVSQKLTFAHRGRGVVWRGAKSAHAILEQPLSKVMLNKLFRIDYFSYFD